MKKAKWPAAPNSKPSGDHASMCTSRDARWVTSGSGRGDRQTKKKNDKENDKRTKLVYESDVD